MFWPVKNVRSKAGENSLICQFFATGIFHVKGNLQNEECLANMKPKMGFAPESDSNSINPVVS